MPFTTCSTSLLQWYLSAGPRREMARPYASSRVFYSKCTSRVGNPTPSNTNETRQYWQGGLQVSTGRRTLDTCNGLRRLPCCLLSLRRWSFAQARDEVHRCNYYPCIHPCYNLPLYPHPGERPYVWQSDSECLSPKLKLARPIGWRTILDSFGVRSLPNGCSSA